MSKVKNNDKRLINYVMALWHYAIAGYTAEVVAASGMCHW